MSDRADEIARCFHEWYERLAPSFGYETKLDSRTNWESVPEPNKALMIAVAENVWRQIMRPYGDECRQAGLEEAYQEVWKKKRSQYGHAEAIRNLKEKP